MAEPDDPLIGTELGRYELRRLIGRGGMGRVYLGVRPDIGSRVAIKVLSEDCSENPALVERFFTEARAVNLIAHENIVSVLDLDRTAKGRPFIVMEYVEGQTLRDLIEAGPLPLGGFVEAMHDVLLGLEAAHAAGIVHRDLKPDNVIVTALGRAKLLDFGIAKLAERPGVRTATGTMLGTPHYMAPEQITGAPCDARTDVYALGVMMFELVTGERPFSGDTDFALMEHQVRTPAPSARTLRPDLPEALADVISRALAKVPSDRFPSARAMADALTVATADLDAAVLVPFAPADLRPRIEVTPPPSPTAATVVDSPARAADAVAPVGRDLNARTQDIAPPTRPGKPGRIPPPARGLSRRAVIVLGTMAAGAVVAAVAVGIYIARLPAMTTSLDAPTVAEIEVDAMPLPAIDAAVPVDAETPVDAAPPVDAGRSSTPTTTVAAKPPDPQCAGTEACTDQGWCEFHDGECRASDAGCAASENCRALGRCSLFEGACWASTTAHCKRSQICKREGYCKLVDHRCAPPDDAACARYAGCKKYGDCFKGQYECIASPTTCRESTECLANRRCRFENGHCFPERMVPDLDFQKPGGR